MNCVRLGAVSALLLVLTVRCSTAAAPIIVSNPNNTYELLNNGTVCLYTSFNMKFTVTYATGSQSNLQVMVSNFDLPPSDKLTSISGECESSLDLRWTDVNDNKAGVTLNFTKEMDNNRWTIKRVAFSFVPKNSTFDDPLVYETNENNTNLLNRTFSLQQYFYCKRCKTFYLTELSQDSFDDGLSIPCNTSSMCSFVEMTEAVIYPGNVEADGMKKLVCIEDYIALQEVIVPVVVGGILAFLLLGIFVAYTIAYFRRRRKENRQYEPMGDSNY